MVPPIGDDHAMPPQPWTRDPVGMLERVHATEASMWGASMTLWATWSVESLDYADELDEDFYARGNTRGFHPDVVDLAHMRWATAAAATAIDQCAAALGLWYCEVGFRARQTSLDSLRNHALKGNLPQGARDWASSVRGDADYRVLRDARDSLVHSQTNRSIKLSTVPFTGHKGRLEVPLGKAGSYISARDLVVLSRAVAHRHVQTFLDRIDAGLFGPTAKT